MSAIINPTAAVQEGYEYQAYGKPVYLDRAWVRLDSSMYVFTILLSGYSFDTMIDTYMIRHRQLDPFIGRWFQRDSLRADNFYQYANNNPASLLDPNGQKPMVFDFGDAGGNTVWTSAMGVYPLPNGYPGWAVAKSDPDVNMLDIFYEFTDQVGPQHRHFEDSNVDLD